MNVAIQVALGLAFFGYGLFGILKKEISFSLRGSAGADNSINITGIPAVIGGLSLIAGGIVCFIPIVFYDLFDEILGDRDTANSLGIGLSIAIVAVGVFLSIALHIAIGVGESIRNRDQDDQ